MHTVGTRAFRVLHTRSITLEWSSDPAIHIAAIAGKGFPGWRPFHRNLQNPSQSLSLSLSVCLVLFGFPSLNTSISTNMVLLKKQQLFCLKIV